MILSHQVIETCLVARRHAQHDGRVAGLVLRVIDGLLRLGRVQRGAPVPVPDCPVPGLPYLLEPRPRRKVARIRQFPALNLQCLTVFDPCRLSGMRPASGPDSRTGTSRRAASSSSDWLDIAARKTSPPEPSHRPPQTRSPASPGCARRGMGEAGDSSPGADLQCLSD